MFLALFYQILERVIHFLTRLKYVKKRRKTEVTFYKLKSYFNLLGKSDQLVVQFDLATNG